MVTKRGAKSTVKNGKLALQGVKGVGLKGAKSFKGMGKRLMKKLGFDKFRVTRKGKRFKLEGHINPWVLLADGTIVDKDIDGKVGDVIKDADGKVTGVIVGTKGSTKNGVKVGGETSGLVTKLDEAVKAGNKAKNKELFDNLTDTGKFKDTAARANKIKGGSGVPRNPNFRKNFFKMVEDFGLKVTPNAQKFLAIHHVVPNFLKGNAKVAKLLEDVGHNIDDVMNAIALPRIDINHLDNIIKQMDEALAVGKNADDFIKQIDEIKATLKLGDDVDITELKRISEELKDIKGASIHAVDTYHPKFNKEVKEIMLEFTSEYDKLIKKFGKEKASNFIKEDVTDYLNGLFSDLLSGNPKTLK